jgi:FkbM family methyltransferase
MTSGAELSLPVRAALRVTAYGLGALPVGTGQHRAVNQVYKRCLSRAANPVDLTMTFNDGTCFELDVTDFTQAQAYLTRRYDPELVQFINAQLSPGDVYIDVGAHVGMVAVSVARSVAGVRVHAFEPHPINADRFLRNQKLNEVSSITVNRMAVGDQNGELTLASPGGGSDSFYVSDSDDDGPRVPVTTLDDYAKEHRLSEVQLLKLDVEGYEPAVLRGAKDLIAAGRIKVIVCELSSSLLMRSGSSESSLVGWLADRDYSIHELPRFGLHRLRNIPANHYRNVAFVYGRAAVVGKR